MLILASGLLTLHLLQIICARAVSLVEGGPDDETDSIIAPNIYGKLELESCNAD